MAKRDSTPDTPVSPSKTYYQTKDLPPNTNFTQQLTALDDGLYRLLCVMQFYRETMESAAGQDEPALSTEWHYGAYLVSEWMSETGNVLRQQVEGMRPAS